MSSSPKTTTTSTGNRRHKKNSSSGGGGSASGLVAVATPSQQPISRRRSIEKDPTDAMSMAANYEALRMRADSTGSTRGAFAPVIAELQSQGRPRLRRLNNNKGKSPYHRHRAGRKQATERRRSSGGGGDLAKAAATAAAASTATDPLAKPPVAMRTPPTKDYKSLDTTSKQDVAAFAAMALQEPAGQVTTEVKQGGADDDDSSSGELSSELSIEPTTFGGKIRRCLNPVPWLLRDLKVDEETEEEYFDDWAGWSVAGFVRHYFYNPLSPEFTSIQQFVWAVTIGIVMGVYTAVWKLFIETCVDFVWETVPTALLEAGLFTDLDGAFPLYHYMWITPALFGGVLSYVFVTLDVKIPDQNDWINNVHSRGVLDYSTFWNLFFLSTAGMASGLSLGPELPLVLTSGMFGSFLGLLCKQSMLQARVLNLTAASAAVGGFFGFPMAGALFVLEIPHRMGLQYFEALSPATISSIVAVLTNRMVINNDVTGYYNYPFLTSALPSIIFTNAVVYGLYGSIIGVCYVTITKKLKVGVHDLFHAPHHEEENKEQGEAADQSENPVDNPAADEKTPLMSDQQPGGKKKKKKRSKKNKPRPPPFWQTLWHKIRTCTLLVIPHEPHRAAAAGVIAGGLVGVICMFFPHVMFWGEAQLQSLIDKGRTPLPVFGEGEEPTAALVALGRCMIDHDDPQALKQGVSIQCSAMIALAKTVVTGLSLGTGIVGGHFWGPLFVGCAMSHLFSDLMKLMGGKVGFAVPLGAHPTVVILCTMGSTHVVTFRAHMAIMLILTLTISAFDPEDNVGESVSGDYSAVFPLLVVSVFVSLMASRDIIFYPTQRSRGDIMAVPEVLCEPGMEGRPLVLDYESDDDDDDDEKQPVASARTAVSSLGGGGASDVETGLSLRSSDHESVLQKLIHEPVTQVDIEHQFEQTKQASGGLYAPSPPTDDLSSPPKSLRQQDLLAVIDNPTKLSSPTTCTGLSPQHFTDNNNTMGASFLAPLPPKTAASGLPPSPQHGELTSSRLDELLSAPIEPSAGARNRHRRIHSAPVMPKDPAKVALPPVLPMLAPGRSEYARRFGDVSGAPSGSSTTSAPAAPGGGGGASSLRERADSASSKRDLVRVTTYGEISNHQPSLMDQARSRAATGDSRSSHRRVPSLSKALRHGRTPSSDAADMSSFLANIGKSPPTTKAAAADLGATVVAAAAAATAATNPPPTQQQLRRGRRHHARIMSVDAASMASKIYDVPPPPPPANVEGLNHDFMAMLRQNTGN